MKTLQEHIRRSRLGHWALAYTGGAWLTLQVVDVLADQFQWPLRLQQSITVILVAGLLVTVVLAWYHGEKGHQRFTAAELLIIGSLLLLAGVTLRVLRSPGDVAARPELWPSRPVSPPTVVAVLPFHNLSGDPADDPLASGLHEDILTQLSGIADLTVISRRSVLEYAEENRNLREVGAELGARSLLEGSIRRDGGRLRFTVQLIDAVTDSHLWAQTYDRTLEDVFEIQSEVARQVSAALEATLTPDENRRLGRPVAPGTRPWALVQRARAVGARGATDLATHAEEERLLREALVLDPEYALARAMLSLNFANRSWNLGMGMEWADSARIEARRAIELQPDLATAHYALGVAYHEQGFLDGAEASYHTAIEMDPNMVEAHRALGRIAAVRGRFGQAIAHLRDALVREPRGFDIRTQLGHAYAALGDLDSAEQWFEAELELRRRIGSAATEVEAWAHWWAGRLEDATVAAAGDVRLRSGSPVAAVGLAELELMAGDPGEALRFASEALELAGDEEDLAYLFFATTTLGAALRQLGDTAAARLRFEASRASLLKEVEQQDQYPLTYLELAAVEEALGRRPDALRWAQRAFDLGSRHVHLIESYPAFAELRRAPELLAILEAMRDDVARQRERVLQSERAAGLR